MEDSLSLKEKKKFNKFKKKYFLNILFYNIEPEFRDKHFLLNMDIFKADLYRKYWSKFHIKIIKSYICVPIGLWDLKIYF